MAMEDLASRLCRDGVDGLAQDGTIAIGNIRDPLTQVATELFVRVVGYTAPERIGGGMILMVERAMVGTQFAWGALMRSRILAQLRECSREAGKGFTFAGFLFCFFGGQVPSLRPHLYVDDLGPWVPQMVRWARLIPCTGGMDPEVGRAFFVTALAFWLHRMGLVDRYFYAGMDFRGDPELRASVGRPWGDAGMFCFYTTTISNYVFEICCFVDIYHVYVFDDIFVSWFCRCGVSKTHRRRCGSPGWPSETAREVRESGISASFLFCGLHI